MKTHFIELFKKSLKEKITLENKENFSLIPFKLRSLSLIELKIWVVLINNGLTKLDSQAPYIITIKELKELIGWKPTTSNTNFNANDSLNNINKHLNNLLSYYHITNTSLIEYSFNPNFIKTICNLSGKVHKLQNILKFKSKYSILLYYYFLHSLYHYYYIHSLYSIPEQVKRTISLSELRNFLVLKDREYKSIGDFNRWILKPAIEEINNNSDIYIKIEPFKNIGSRKNTQFKNIERR